MSPTMTKAQRTEAHQVLIETLKSALLEEMAETHGIDAHHWLTSILASLIAARMSHGSGSEHTTRSSSLKQYVCERLIPEIETHARVLAPRDTRSEVTLILAKLLVWSATSIHDQAEGVMGLST